MRDKSTDATTKLWAACNRSLNRADELKNLVNLAQSHPDIETLQQAALNHANRAPGAGF